MPRRRSFVTVLRDWCARRSATPLGVCSVRGSGRLRTAGGGGDGAGRTLPTREDAEGLTTRRMPDDELERRYAELLGTSARYACSRIETTLGVVGSPLT